MGTLFLVSSGIRPNMSTTREMLPPPPAPRHHPSSCTHTNPPTYASSAAPAASATSSLSVAKPASSVQRLTPDEVAHRRKDGQCFHCNEFFTNGHKAVCKQLFYTEVIEDVNTPADDTDTHVISIHALTSIRPSQGAPCSFTSSSIVLKSPLSWTRGPPTVSWILTPSSASASNSAAEQGSESPSKTTSAYTARAIARICPSPSATSRSLSTASALRSAHMRWCLESSGLNH
jgi:hypothetical protein